MMQEVGKAQRVSRSAVAAQASSGKKRSSAPAALIDIADTLYRTAAVSCSEHRRYADLVERSVADAEQKSARLSVRACDEALDEAADLYEVACLKESNHADDAWWHRANMVWRAAKEFLRHHATSDKMTRGAASHGRAELLELTIEYKLEASAILRLRHTIDAYRDVRPEAGPE
jgi:hypothetical protein